MVLLENCYFCSQSAAEIFYGGAVLLSEYNDVAAMISPSMDELGTFLFIFLFCFFHPIGWMKGKKKLTHVWLLFIHIRRWSWLSPPRSIHTKMSLLGGLTPTEINRGGKKMSLILAMFPLTSSKTYDWINRTQTAVVCAANQNTRWNL